MTIPVAASFGRKVSLQLVQGSKALNLSQSRFTFKTSQTDESSPNSCLIRVYNLKPETMSQIQGEYSRVVLQAGYAANFAVIFDGTITQYRIGRENQATAYLDIMAADGDVAHNFGIVNDTMAPGTSARDRVNRIKEAMGLGDGFNALDGTGGVLPRGKVLFGMGRVAMSAETQSQFATWSIQNGKLQVTKLDGYLPGEAVVLTSKTGLIGRVEQTEEGMKAKCLLNPRIIPGGLLKIDNKSINTTTNTSANAGNVPYNQWAAVQLLANVDADGLYRVYVAEHEGDTRGQQWYTDIVCLAVNRQTQKVKPYG